MPDLYDEYIKAVSANITLEVLTAPDRMHLYTLILKKDYQGVYQFLKERIPDLYDKVSIKLNEALF